MSTSVRQLHAPLSTYRLQLHAGFTFEDAAAVLDYLSALGVSHAYTSPILRAVAGSAHGYDVIDPSQINPELKPAQFDPFVDALHARDMGYLLDIVPNHMGIDTNDNPWWNDLLKHGQKGPRGAFFDIDWHGSHRPSMAGKVLLPVLGKPYGEALEAGEIKLVREDDAARVAYYDKRFPLRDDPGDVDAINADVDRLDEILQQQHYRLAYWRSASDEINYRRFFDVNTLAAIAMENREVFDEAHQVVFTLIDAGKIDGLRLDHPDGLFDPRQYFERLQEHRPEPLYVVAEKILEMNEPLDPDWPIDGTSGYDFLVHVNALFVDRENEAAFTQIYDDFTESHHDIADICYRSKLQILDLAMASELHMLTLRLDRIAQTSRHTRDYTFAQLRAALRETIARFGVYRTYIRDGHIGESDAEQIRRAIDKATRSARHVDPHVFQFLHDTLLSDPAFAGRFQQLTSPVTAKGIEDTAFYRYHRLISLNEVGGDPSHFGIEPADLHAYFRDRQQHWPGSLSTLSTHDTKRSEDVRARINAISAMPDEWRETVFRLRRVNREHGIEIDPNDEYLLYQTLVGAWPIEPERLKAYMLKALREAKQRTDWNTPDTDYEQRVDRFIDQILASSDFMRVFAPFAERVAKAGWINSLSQTTIKCFAPGVPDTYQGTELLDLSLVDPDNRRPVDYAARAAALKQIETGPQSGLEKLHVLSRSLRFRRDHAELMQQGTYEPLDGPRQSFAFARVLGQQFVIAIVPRLRADSPTSVTVPASLQGRLARNLLDGRTQTLGNHLPAPAPHAALPVAVWVDHDPSH